MAAPLVILPGLMCDSRMFEAQALAFDGQVVDGFYGSADRIEAMAEYALPLLPDRFSLLGHSMGARVALEIWRLASHRIERLALADTGVHSVRTGEAENRYRLRDLGREQGINALADAWLSMMIGSADHTELFAMLKAMVVDAGVDTFARQTEALLHRRDARSLLSQIDCPAMAIVGADDQWAPIAQHEDFVADIPGAELRVIANAGHMAPAEDPAAFNVALGEWLAMTSNATNDKSDV